jgi:hypothetical protein
VDPTAPFPQTELRLRSDVVLGELDRLHAEWGAGRVPSSADLLAVADDLAALRETITFSAVVAAFEAPAWDGD